MFLLSLSVSALEQDKRKHMVATSAISSMTYGVMRSQGKSLGDSIMYAILFSNAVGIAKELSDERVDGKDINANIIGSLMGVSFALVWEF